MLTWNYYVMPMWYLSKFRVAYWNKFSRPSIRPKYALGLGTWWMDKDKEAKLPKTVARDMARTYSAGSS